MTLQQLEAKRDDLAKQKEQMLANLNAIVGAVQMVEQLIEDERKAQEKQPLEVDSPG